MAPEIQTENQPSMASLVSGIVSDAQKLIRQELELARQEVRQEWTKARDAAISMAAAAGAVFFAAMMFLFGLVYLLGSVTPIPAWGWFLLVGGVLGALAAVLFFTGKTKAEEVSVIPPRTAETMKENVEWLQNPK
jgi:hypothetical protein